MRQTFIILIIVFGLNSCSNKQRDSEQRFPKVQLGENIDIRDFDEQTGWTRTLLKEPHCWGFIDKDSVVKISFVFKYINPFDSLNMTYGQIGEKYGVINVNYDTIIPFIYDELRGFEHGFARAVLNKKHGFINRNGETIIPFDFDDAHSFINCGIAKVNKSGKWGFIDLTGNEIIPCIYETVDYNKHDSIVLIKKGNKTAFFSYKGVQLTDFKYSKVHESYLNDKSYQSTYNQNGLIMVEIDGKTGYLNNEFETVIPYGKYAISNPFNESKLAIVANYKYKYGVINSTGQIVILFDYELIKHPNRYSSISNVFVVKKNGMLGLLDRNAKEVTELNNKSIEWDYIRTQRTNDGYYLIQNSYGNFGVLNGVGDTIIPFDYLEMEPFDGDSLTIVKKGNKYGIIDYNNNTIRDFDCDAITTGQWYDYYIINVQGKYGIISKSNDEIIPLMYESIVPCHYDQDNRLIVELNGKYGVVDITNKVIISIEYDEISNWVEYGPKEHFIVKNGKRGLISREGNIVIPPVYDEIFVDNGTLIKVKRNGLYGTINWKNEIIHPIDYENILWEWPYLTGKPIDTIYIEKSGNYFATDIKGKTIVESVSKKLIDEKFGYLMRSNEFLIDELEIDEFILDE